MKATFTLLFLAALAVGQCEFSLSPVFCLPKFKSLKLHKLFAVHAATAADAKGKTPLEAGEAEKIESMHFNYCLFRDRHSCDSQSSQSSRLVRFCLGVEIAETMVTYRNEFTATDAKTAAKAPIESEIEGAGNVKAPRAAAGK